MRHALNSRFLPTFFALLSVSCGALAQANWPDKPVNFVVPSAPGGSTDSIARLVAEPLSKALGQPVVIDSRTAGAGNIGAEAALRGGSDGHTLLMQYSDYHVGNKALFPGAEVRKVIESPELRAKVDAQGAFAAYAGPAQLNAFVQKEPMSWADIIRAANIKPESR